MISKSLIDEVLNLERTQVHYLDPQKDANFLNHSPMEEQRNCRLLSSNSEDVCVAQYIQVHISVGTCYRYII
jgi:hypothetical protein